MDTTNSSVALSTCAVLTQTCRALGESTSDEFKAYKLGRKRYSYNEVELLIESGDGTNRKMGVKQIISSQETQDGGVKYDIILANSMPVKFHAYLCLENPRMLEQGPTDTQGNGHSYQWTLVDRSSCCRGCQGPVLRALQRFGKLGKRQQASNPEPNSPTEKAQGQKDRRCMYLSFDEPGSHVGGQRFRLVGALLDASGTQLYATTVSAPIRVVANNDMRNGAAHIQLVATVPSTWQGWASEMATAQSDTATNNNSSFAPPVTVPTSTHVVVTPQGQPSSPLSDNMNNNDHSHLCMSPNGLQPPSPFGDAHGGVIEPSVPSVYDGVDVVMTDTPPQQQQQQQPQDLLTFAPSLQAVWNEIVLKSRQQQQQQAMHEDNGGPKLFTSLSEQLYRGVVRPTPVRINSGGAVTSMPSLSPPTTPVFQFNNAMTNTSSNATSIATITTTGSLARQLTDEELSAAVALASIRELDV